MATYIVGDLQGCYKSFTQLLKILAFNPSKDILWTTGDLINRGDNSLATLRLVYENRDSIFTVLGNHDLHLLSTYYQNLEMKPSDTFLDILLAPDAETMLSWLKEQPLCHLFEKFNLFLSHAGLYPAWTIKQALSLGESVRHQLCSAEPVGTFFSPMYGNTPSQWSDALQGTDRTRFVINALTRMRFLTADLSLDMANKHSLEKVPSGLYPWFNHPTPLSGESNIAFGHWASLQGNIDSHSNSSMAIYPLDTGCVWNGHLTALHLESMTLISTKSTT